VTIQLIKFLTLKKVRVPLVMLNSALFLTAIFLCRSFQGKGFLFLGFATLFLLQMPYFYENWTKHGRPARPFFLIMGAFMLGFLLMASFIFTVAAS
jgi:hypothetical protein